MTEKDPDYMCSVTSRTYEMGTGVVSIVVPGNVTSKIDAYSPTSLNAVHKPYYQSNVHSESSAASNRSLSLPNFKPEVGEILVPSFPVYDVVEATYVGRVSKEEIPVRNDVYIRSFSIEWDTEVKNMLFDVIMGAN